MKWLSASLKTARSMRELSVLEARVLGVLVEKERTVPDAYPLSLNALSSGCNQKTSRNPVMTVADAQVLSAIDSLRGLSLVIESSGGRVMRYAQNVRRVLQVPAESVALLATLMLRGPQTAAELRANSERLCRFSDLSAVEGFLDELAGRSAGALVQELPRQAGSRENRWMHLLCGDAGLAAADAPAAASQGVQVDLPEVLAEVRLLLTTYERARAGHDRQALGELLWQSPKARHDSAHPPWSGEGSGPDAAEPRRRVTTFGRDFASTSISLAADGLLPAGVECQAWVRLAEGWRIVASCFNACPPDQG